MNQKALLGLLIAPWVTGAVLLSIDSSRDVHDATPIVATLGDGVRTEPSSRVTPSVAEIEHGFATIDRSMRKAISHEQRRAPEIEATLSQHIGSNHGSTRPAVNSAGAGRPLWTATAAPVSAQTPADSLRPQPIQRVSLDGPKLANLQPGDVLNLPPINGLGYSARVQSVAKPTPGTTQVTASIEAHGGTGSMTLTQGARHTFGTIATPSDTFELEAVGDEGSIFFAKDFDHLIDHTKNDFIVVSDAGHALGTQQPRAD